MAKFIGEVILAEEDQFLAMQDGNGNKIDLALLGTAKSQEGASYLLLQLMDGTMDEDEAVVFLETEEGLELVEDMELVEGIFDAFNSLIKEAE